MSTDTREWSGDVVRASVGQRLDVFLARELGRSRAQVQALLKAGGVRLGPGVASASHRLRGEDAIRLEDIPGVKPPQVEPQGEDIPLDILYEDDALLAINKQPGLVVHPAAGNWSGTLVNALVHHCGTRLATRGGGERLGIVHRLDKDTSGVLVVAKTDLAHERLSRAFAAREVVKLYRALCRGTFRRASGEIREAIGRHPRDRKKMAVIKTANRARTAWTDYRVLRQGNDGAEVECRLHTGRTHQIRVHLAHLGHAILGDAVYGRAALQVGGTYPLRQMLHAARIELAHPITGDRLTIDAPLPADYAACRTQLLD
jgi:23S rRNA pseudouridine1911/1915/1917 synthase